MVSKKMNEWHVPQGFYDMQEGLKKETKNVKHLAVSLSNNLSEPGSVNRENQEPA